MFRTESIISQNMKFKKWDYNNSDAIHQSVQKLIEKFNWRMNSQNDNIEKDQENVNFSTTSKYSSPKSKFIEKLANIKDDPEKKHDFFNMNGPPNISNKKKISNILPLMIFSKKLRNAIMFNINSTLNNSKSSQFSISGNQNENKVQEIGFDIEDNELLKMPIGIKSIVELFTICESREVY